MNEYKWFEVIDELRRLEAENPNNRYYVADWVGRPSKAIDPSSCFTYKELKENGVVVGGVFKEIRR